MEQLNSVTLRGIIGNARIQNIGDTEMARFSVATDHAYKNRSGEAVIEVTWHQVTAFKNDKMPDFSTLVKGAERRKTKGKRIMSMDDAMTIILVVVLFILLKPILGAILRGFGSSEHRRDR